MTNETIAKAQHEDRQRHVAQAQAWTAAQAARLEITPEAIDQAIRNGWLPGEIQKVRHATELLRRRR